MPTRLSVGKVRRVYEFIKTNRHEYDVRTLCRLLEVAASEYYAWLREPVSRPDDNPFSEAQFRTLKYRPDFPARFGSIEDARAHRQAFFTWYNTEHRHSGIGLMPPDVVHHGRDAALTARRTVALDAAFVSHPARFEGVAPRPPHLPTTVWINPPAKETTLPAITPECWSNS